MRYGNSISIDHSVLLGPHCSLAKNGEFTSHTTEGEFGSIVSQRWHLPAIDITGIFGSLQRNLHVRHHEYGECCTINSCYVIKGNIRSRFAGLPDQLTLTKGCHNFIYKPEVLDDHFLSAEGNELSLLHVAIDRSRFIDLLCMEEKWCDELKRKIRCRQMASGPECPLSISSAMYRTIDDIINCPVTGSLGTILLEAKALELIVYQLHQYNGFNLTIRKPMSRSDRETFFEIKTYLESAYEKDHSLRSLARQFGINEFKLKKGFREQFGTTVFGYIHILKMHQARTLMQDAGASVSEAASRTGYKNPNHFSAAFKKQFGLSPSALRRTHELV